MEKPKQPNIFKRHRGRGFGEKKIKKETRETRRRFWMKQAGPSYLPGPRGKAARKRHEKARAKNKRSRTARKKNR
jgi:hypothetical protein